MGVPLSASLCRAAQQPRGLRRCSRRVLDRLRLVQDHVIELRAAQRRHIAPHRAVCREHEVELVERREHIVAARPVILGHSERGRESLGLALPVEQQRSRRHNQRGPRRAALLDAPRVEQRQHGHRFAEAHVVSQASAKLQLLEEAQPAEAKPLVAAQRAHERHWRVGGRNALERAQPVAHVEGAAGPRHAFAREKQSVEQPELRSPHMHTALGSATSIATSIATTDARTAARARARACKGRKPTVLRHPRICQHADGLIRQHDRRLAVPHRRQ